MAYPEAIYRASFEQPECPLAVVDGSGALALWNEAFDTLFHALAGVRPERLRGSFFEFITAREGHKLDYYAAELFLGGRSSASVETALRAADGTKRWVKLRLSLLETPSRPEAEAPLERLVLVSMEDATERILRERRLTEAKEEAEKATHTKSQFLANMSHEIRTPIQTILGVVELLEETELDGEQAEYVSQVRFSADVLLGLINDILDFSKIEVGKLDLETIDFDLRACVHQSVDLLVMEAHRKGLEVIVDIDDELPALVRGDPARIRQIIVNLFKNAIKFTHDGSISLRLRHRQGPKGERIRYEIADTGIGMSEEVRTRLFTPFYQADFAAARKAGGTGLGLAISRHLAELMGGSIGVLPNEPRGSVFWFETPLSAPDFSAPPERGSAGSPARLLIVDDHEGAREFARRIAIRAGYRVAVAASGEEALAALRAASRSGEPFDLCLIDQNMPVMDGWRLASEITGDTAINETRLVLMVPEGMISGDAKMKLLRWFNAYVAKPLRPELFFETLEKALAASVDLEPAEQSGAEARQPRDGTEQASTSPERTFPADILIAEDHEVNRELFTVILSRLGCRVTTARDGAEALELASAAHFDLVLMDIFMPRMNGYEAAEALRRRGFTAPIVAVTASALKGEREKCLAAGMNDILVKPFKKHDLAAVLEAWLPEARHNAGATDGRGEEVETPSFEAGDPGIFDWEGVLDTFLGQRDTVVSLLKKFRESASRQLGELIEAEAAKDYPRFREIAHSLKGASWNLAARKLGDAALAAENAGREADAQAAAAALRRLKPAFAAFLAATEAYIR